MQALNMATTLRQPKAVIHSLECGLIDRSVFQNRADAQLAVFDYIEGWYNPHRRHSALGQLSPINFERQVQAALAACAPKIRPVRKSGSTPG